MTRAELWLWPVAITTALAIHAGLALILPGRNAEAAATPSEFRITISPALQAGLTAAPTTSSVALAVPATTTTPVPENFAQPSVTAHVEPLVPPTAAAMPVPVVAAAVPALAPVVAGPGQEAMMAPHVGPAASPVATPSIPGPVAAAVPPAAPVIAGPGSPPLALAEITGPAATIAALGNGDRVSLPVAVAVSATPVAPRATPARAAVPNVLAGTSVSDATIAAVPAAPPAASTSPAVANSPLAPGIAPTIAVSGTSNGAPQPASALSIAPGAITNGPTGASPVAPAQVAVPVASSGQATIIASLPDDVVLIPAEPEGVPTPNALDRFVAEYDGGPCFAASVVRGGPPMLAAFAREMVDNVALQLALGKAFIETVDIDSHRVDSRQCEALAFVSRLQQTAGVPMAMALASQAMADGAHLIGTLAAPSGQQVHLFIVDDEGRVSDSSAYLSGEGPDSTFSVPVHLSGDSQARIQLLIAVSTTQMLPPGPSTASVDAEAFFADLAPRLASGSTSVAIDAFIVR